jgi:hypothetical protein
MYAEPWICKDGRRLHVFEMQTSHLFFAVRLIDRSGGAWRGRWRQRLVDEINNRKLLTPPT